MAVRSAPSKSKKDSFTVSRTAVYVVVALLVGLILGRGGCSSSEQGYGPASVEVTRG